MFYMNTAKVRRYDLDWLRVSVFGILIIYHVGMYFVPWKWHIKHELTYDWISWPMIFINQWRLPILFIISGMGTRFALSHRSGQLFRKERLMRLGIPLLVGVILIVPPQLYIERILSGDFEGSFGLFYVRECFRGIYPEGNLSWHHLWFLPYLLLFSLILSPLLIHVRDNSEKGAVGITRRLLGFKFGIYLFTIPLIIIEILLEPFFPVTHALLDDWYTIALYITLFFIGYLFICCQTEFWNAVNQIKAYALLMGIISFSSYYAINTFIEDGHLAHIIEACIKMINMLSWIIVLFGFSGQFLNRPSKLLKYCNEAVYPFYILHQTVQIVLAYFLIQLQLPPLFVFLLLILGTFLVSWLLYEFLIRRIKFIRPLFGLKN